MDKSHKNLLIVLADCLRYDQHKVFDWLLRRGGIFYDNAWAVAGATIPSAFSAMTGKMPHDHGMIDKGCSLAVPTILDRLKEEMGYHVHFVSENPLWGREAVTGGTGFGWLDLCNLDEPWVAFYHNMSCHFPLEDHPISTEDGKPIDYYRATQRGKLSYYDWANVWRAYARAVLGLSYRLEKLVRYHDCSVILFADHGEELWEHERLGHQGWWWTQETLHVPVWVSSPSQIHWRLETQAISLLDLPRIIRAAAIGATPSINRGDCPLQDYQNGYKEGYVSEREIFEWDNPTWKQPVPSERVLTTEEAVKLRERIRDLGYEA